MQHKGILMMADAHSSLHNVPTDRRTFLQHSALGVSVLATGVALGLPTLANAQDSSASNSAFKPAKKPVPRTPGSKIEVIEFFWYGCPHCYAFEPTVNAWVKTLPTDVIFTKVPIRWPTKRVNYEGHQKLFYTLEVLGVLPTAHIKVFEAIHKDKKPLANDVEIFDFAKSIGLQREQFANTFKGFAVSTKVAMAAKTIEAYGPDGVPTLGVGGQFYTSAQIAGSEQNAIKVAEQLIKRVRQG